MPQRSYERLCGLSRALELIGDRWTLLIVRQLLTGPKRYVDLHQALNGLSTNLLSERMRRLEADGLVIHRTLPPPAASSVYELTEFGAGVEPAILELMRWGSILLADPERISEPSDPDWPLFPLRWLATRVPLEGDQLITIEIGEDAPLAVAVEGNEARLVFTEAPDERSGVDLAMRATSSAALGAVLGGHIGPREAVEDGSLELLGDSSWLLRALREAYAEGESKT